MNYDINDFGKFYKALMTTAGEGSSYNTSAPGSSADVVTGHIDRFKLNRRYRGCMLAIPLNMTLGTGARVDANVRLQDAAGSTGPWADVVGANYGTTSAIVSQILGGACSSAAGPTIGVLQASFNLQPARRYVRGVYNLGVQAGVATSSGTIIEVKGPPVFVFGGGEEVPVDSGLVPTSST